MTGEPDDLEDRYVDIIQTSTEDTKTEDQFNEQMRLNYEESKKRLMLRIELLDQMTTFMQFVKIMVPTAILLLAWHNFTPPSWGWLDKDQTDWLKRVMYGSFFLISSSVALRGLASKYLPEQE